MNDQKGLKRDEHIAKHKELHRRLDQLAADFIDQTGCFLSQSTVMDLIEWSYEQTKNPTEREQ